MNSYLIILLNFFHMQLKTKQIINWAIDDIAGTLDFQCGINGSPAPPPPPAPLLPPLPTLTLNLTDRTLMNHSIFCCVFIYLFFFEKGTSKMKVKKIMATKQRETIFY